MSQSAVCRLPFEPQAARSVRSRLRADLAGLDVTPEVVDDALLVATELVSNAIRHGRAQDDHTLSVRWEHDGRFLDLVVCDAGVPLRRPASEDVGPDATRGRGLAIVEALTTSWWVEDPPGTAVHARLRLR